MGTIDTITLSDWLHDSSIKPKSLWNRRAVVRIFEKANRCDMKQMLEDFQAEKVSVYFACKEFMDYLRKHYASYTCYTYRSVLPGLFESVLGEDWLDVVRGICGDYRFGRNDALQGQEDMNGLLERLT